MAGEFNDSRQFSWRKNRCERLRSEELLGFLNVRLLGSEEIFWSMGYLPPILEGGCCVLRVGHRSLNNLYWLN